MALQQAIGATISVSAATPATHNQAGFEALTFTKVGRPTKFPAMRGSRDNATFDDLETGEELKFPDMYRAGDDTLTVGLDGDDAGQVIIAAAEEGSGAAAHVSLKVELDGGEVFYRMAIVNSYMPTDITVGSIVKADIGFGFYGRTVSVPAP